VCCRWCDDVDYVDVGVVGQFIHRVITEHVLIFDPVFLLPFGYFLRSPRNDSRQVAMLCMLQ
jgi:hypothetical protein